jgi:hypothetical protein
MKRPKWLGDSRATKADKQKKARSPPQSDLSLSLGRRDPVDISVALDCAQDFIERDAHEGAAGLHLQHAVRPPRRALAGQRCTSFVLGQSHPPRSSRFKFVEQHLGSAMTFRYHARITLRSGRAFLAGCSCCAYFPAINWFLIRQGERPRLGPGPPTSVLRPQRLGFSEVGRNPQSSGVPMVPCYRGYQRAASNQLSRRADPQPDYFKKSVFLVDTFHPSHD